MIGIGVIFYVIVFIFNHGSLSPGIGNVTSDNLPPVGTVWFGTSFDSTTFEVHDRTTSFVAGSSFVAVTQLPTSVEGSHLQVRQFVDGQSMGAFVMRSSDSGTVWGVNLGPLFAAGTWRIEFADIGGNVLASGEQTVR